MKGLLEATAIFGILIAVTLLVSLLDLAPDQPWALLGDGSFFIPLWRPDPGV